jgi:hypothetical protein
MSDEPLYPECPWCEEPVLPSEPQADTNDGDLIWHKECLLRTMVGSVAHQQERCTCYGGTEDDPPGLSRRQAAAAAALLFQRTQLRQIAKKEEP